MKNEIVRTPLPPKKTFIDDPLRVLRTIRFAQRFGFKIRLDHTYDVHDLGSGAHRSSAFLRGGFDDGRAVDVSDLDILTNKEFPQKLLKEIFFG